MPIGPNSAPVQSTYVSQAVPIPTGTVEGYVRDTQKAIQRRQDTMDGLNSAFAQLKANAIGQDREFLQGAINGVQEELEQYADEPAMVRAREARRLARRFQTNAAPIQQRYGKMQQFKKRLRQRGWSGQDFDQAVEGLRNRFGDLDQESVQTGNYMPTDIEEFSEYRDLGQQALSIAGQLRARTSQGTEPAAGGARRDVQTKSYSARDIENVVRRRLMDGQNGQFLNQKAALNAERTGNPVAEERERILSQHVAQAQDMYARSTTSRSRPYGGNREGSGSEDTIPMGTEIFTGKGRATEVNYTNEELDRIGGIDPDQVAREMGEEPIEEYQAPGLVTSGRSPMPDVPEGMSEERAAEIRANPDQFIRDPNSMMDVFVRPLMDSMFGDDEQLQEEQYAMDLKRGRSSRSNAVQDEVNRRRQEVRDSLPNSNTTSYVSAANITGLRKEIESTFGRARDNENMTIQKYDGSNLVEAERDELSEYGTPISTGFRTQGVDGKLAYQVTAQNDNKETRTFIIPDEAGNLDQLAARFLTSDDASSAQKQMGALISRNGEGERNLDYMGEIAKLPKREGNKATFNIPQFNPRRGGLVRAGDDGYRAVEVRLEQNSDGQQVYKAYYDDGQPVSVTNPRTGESRQIQAANASRLSATLFKLERDQMLMARQQAANAR